MGITIEPAALSGLAVWTETGRVFVSLAASKKLPKSLCADLESFLKRLLPTGDADGWGDQSEED